MILQALLLIAICIARAEHLPCPETYRLTIEEVGCTSGLLASTASSQCLPISRCDDSTKVVALGAEHWEQSYQDVFLCCPEDLDDILESPLSEEECVTKCMLENGMASVASWVDDGTCTCSLSAFGQCDPFGEAAQGYNTCQRYFNTFNEDNCNYNLKSHQICANEDFDYDGEYLQIRDLCPDQCANVAFVEDSLDETVVYDEETGEAFKVSGDRRQLHAGEDHWRTYLISKPYGQANPKKKYAAVVYEHRDGHGKAWRLKVRGCCRRGCYCRSSGHRNLVKSNNKISSITVGPRCHLGLSQHGKGLQSVFGRYSPYDNFGKDTFLNKNVHHNDDASSYKITCSGWNWSYHG